MHLYTSGTFAISVDPNEIYKCVLTFSLHKKSQLTCRWLFHLLKRNTGYLNYSFSYIRKLPLQDFAIFRKSIKLQNIGDFLTWKTKRFAYHDVFRHGSSLKFILLRLYLLFYSYIVSSLFKDWLNVWSNHFFCFQALNRLFNHNEINHTCDYNFARNKGQYSVFPK